MRGGMWISVAAGAMALCGCQVAAQETQVNVSAVPASADAPSKIEVKRDNFAFTYGWPSAANAFPLLRDYFQTDARQLQGELEASFDEDDRLKDPNNEYKPTYETDVDWTIAAQTDDMVSLSGSWYSYMGGAHGMYGVRALSYHKGSDTMLQANEVIADTDAFVGATQEEYCRLLDTERADRRGEPVVRDDMFGECVPLLNQTLIWKSTGGGKFDRLEVFIGPYEAGTYAEGSYVLNLPITAPMVAAIAPQYRANFAVNGGNPYIVEDQ